MEPRLCSSFSGLTNFSCRKIKKHLENDTTTTSNSAICHQCSFRNLNERWWHISEFKLFQVWSYNRTGFVSAVICFNFFYYFLLSRIVVRLSRCFRQLQHVKTCRNLTLFGIHKTWAKTFKLLDKNSCIIVSSYTAYTMQRSTLIMTNISSVKWSKSLSEFKCVFQNSLLHSSSINLCRKIVWSSFVFSVYPINFIKLKLFNLWF